MAESQQQKLSRVRKPRVHLVYEVETNGSMVKTELPFIVGVLGDFAGDSKNQKPLEQRKFTNIDRDNFNDIMTRIAPELEFRVPNTIQGNDTELGVKLAFKSLDDFEPGKLVEQVQPLKELMELRNKLRDLKSTVDRSANLEKILEEVMSNTEKAKSVAGELGAKPGTGGDA
jgi:type VI secretion system protein ImpB